MAKRYKKKLKSESTTAKDANVAIYREDEIIERLNKMSVKERDEGLYDLHGVFEMPDETAEMLTSMIAEMNDILSASYFDLATGASAYRKAMSMDPDYVEQFKLPCLRATQYNSRQGAGKLLRFFELKSELFGEEKLVKEIGLEDLTEDDREFLYNGMQQILPHRDRAGRLVLLTWGKVAIESSVEVLQRVSFFIVMLAVRRDSMMGGQNRGIVFVYYAHGVEAAPPYFMVNTRTRLSKYRDLMRSLPFYIAAVHFCRDSESGKENIVTRGFRALQEFMLPKVLARFRLHQGSELECMYTLMTFGILKEAIQMTSEGNIDLTHHREMLDSLEYPDKTESRFQSKEMEAFDIEDDPQEEQVLVPGPKDIVMGRGRRPTSSQGSRMMYQLVQEMKEEYEAGTKKDKMNLAEKILRTLQEEGFRFLKEKEGSGCEACKDSAARAKIARCFRNERLRNLSKGEKRQRADDEEGM